MKFILPYLLFPLIANATVFQVFCHSDNTNSYIPIKTFKTIDEAEDFSENEDRSCYIEEYEEYKR